MPLTRSKRWLPRSTRLAAVLLLTRDWSAFSETDDYGRGTNTFFADAGKVPAYSSGSLTWGTEP